MVSMTLPEIEQYHQVHTAIQAIASHCDGARTKDNVGFDGTDTKYGRRIASVSFEELTSDDRQEEARIIQKYRSQAEAYTGIDVTQLQVVQDAQEYGTNHNSRQHARDIERRARNADKKDDRKATLLPNGKVALAWVKGDPDFGALLDGVKQLPGRSFNWNTKENEVPLSDALVAFCDEWDINLPADILDRLGAAKQAEAERVHITLEGGQILLRSTKDEAFRLIPTERPYGGVSTKDAFKAYGFRWNGEVWSLPLSSLSAELFDIALAADFKVSADVRNAVSGAQEARQEAETTAALLSRASRAKSLDELPETFLAQVAEVLGR